MIGSDAFLRAAMDRGFDFYTGVPCSFLTPLINGTISSRECNYVGAASEAKRWPSPRAPGLRGVRRW